MCLIASAISSLDASLWLWEWIQYIAEIFVILGCVGEGVAEFTKIKTPEWRHKLNKLSLIVLNASLSVELGSLVRTNSLSGKEIALLNREAADARIHAANAESSVGDVATRLETATGEAKAEEENLKDSIKSAKAEAESFHREMLLAGPRGILLTQARESMVRHLKRFKGQKVFRRVCAEGAHIVGGHEVEYTENAIFLILREAGWSSVNLWEVPPNIQWGCGGASISVGVRNDAPKETRIAAEAL